jgi:hypothetical protein
MPTLSTVQDAIRFLGAIDTRHRELVNVSDRWLERKGYTLLSERAPDGTPLVAVALEADSPCPIDAAAKVQIKYWVANLERVKDLLPAYVKNIAAINAHMASVGAEKVWGLVPKTAEHMTGFLDLAAAAGACKKVDGATVKIDPATSIIPDYEGFWFYVGERQAVTDHMEAG